MLYYNYLWACYDLRGFRLFEIPPAPFSKGGVKSPSLFKEGLGEIYKPR